MRIAADVLREIAAQSYEQALMPFWAHGTDGADDLPARKDRQEPKPDDGFRHEP